MSRGWIARCKSCAEEFQSYEGPSMVWWPLRCDQCGKERRVALSVLWKMGWDWGDEQSNAAIEKRLKRCTCGGRHRFEAPVRCPKCKSTDIEDTHTLYMMID